MGGNIQNEFVIQIRILREKVMHFSKLICFSLDWNWIQMHIFRKMIRTLLFYQNITGTSLFLFLTFKIINMLGCVMNKR
jgi:hypothetical protein